MTTLAVTDRSLFAKHWHAVTARGCYAKRDEFHEIVRSTYGDFTSASPLVNGVPRYQLYVFEFADDADAVAFKLRYTDDLDFIDTACVA